MIPASFEYLRPSTLAQAAAALRRGGEDAKILAGGQSLLPVLRLRLAAPSILIDLGGIDALRGVRADGDQIVVGAMTTHYDVLRSELIRDHVALLAQATAGVADPQVRHRGTLGGALAHADPAGDLGAVAVALDAEFTCLGPWGPRTVNAADFFLGYLSTGLKSNEILTEVRFPRHTGWGSHYEKMNRTSQSWSMVGVAAAVRLDGDTIADARVGLTNMGATPIRAAAVEAALTGGRHGAVQVRDAAAHAAEGTSAPGDLDAEPDYREHLARILTARAVLAACAAASTLTTA